jgi:hypothetical protein
LNNLPNGIEQLVEVPDISIYYLFGTLILIVLTVYFTTKLILKKFNIEEKREKEALIESLRGVDWSDGKNSAYTITEIGRKVSKTDRSRAMLDDIVELLEQFKYRKDGSEPISDSLRQKVELFCEVAENE